MYDFNIFSNLLEQNNFSKMSAYSIFITLCFTSVIFYLIVKNWLSQPENNDVMDVLVDVLERNNFANTVIFKL